MNVDNFGPCYDFGWPDQPVELLQNMPAEVEIEGELHTGTASARFVPWPMMGILVKGLFNSPLPTGTGPTEPKIASLRIGGREVPGYADRIFEGVDSFSVTWWSAGHYVAKGSAVTQMDHVVFHLLTYVRPDDPPWGQPIDARGTKNSLGGGWEVQLRLCLDSDIVGAPEGPADVPGGWTLSRIGYLRRENGLAFTGKEALDVLEALRYFWSFLSGFGCSLDLPVGFDAQGARVWEVWEYPTVPPRGVWSIYPDICTKDLFSNFMERWATGGWQDAIRAAVYWYLVSNGMGHHCDAGVILTQTALERLAYEYVVNDRKLLISESFKKVPASDQIRLLLGSLGIPTEIPSCLPQLTEFVDAMPKDKKWLDAIHAFTEVRNSIIHPEKKQYGKLDVTELYPDVWNMGQWLFELALLRIIGYDGRYANRLRKDDDIAFLYGEPVPWEQAKEASS